MSCLQRAELKCFLAGELSAPAAAELALHVENCAACEQALAELTDNESLPLKSEPTGDADATKLEPTGEVLNRLHASLPRTSGLHPPLGRSRTSWHSEPRIAAGDTAAVAVPPAVPGYEILCELSRGGMGVVYKARQVALNRVVALKMVLIEAHAGHARLARFRTEAEAVARLQHPNIVQIYDIGEHAGCPYFSMELIDGPTLTEACGGRPQSPGSAAALAEALARAIHSAHLQGIIHRDLKPDNILLVFSREPLAGATSALAGGSRLNEAVPKIIDFGLAKRQGDVRLTQQGQVLGTPSYMAPEQITSRSGEVSPAADVYALGAVLYELLTGRPPFLADSVESTLNQVICEEPIPLRRLQPKVPRDLETICLKCLEKSPARRYTQAIDLAEDLRRFRANEPITARPPSAWDRAAKFVRRHKALVAGVAVTLAAMLVGTIVSVLFALGESRQRHRADDNAQRREEARRQAEWEAYLARLAVAQARLDGHSLREAAKQLDKAPEQLRRWEWLYLHSRLDDSSAVVGEPEPRPEYPALLPASGHVVLASRDHGLSLWDADNHWLKDLGEGRVLAVASSRTESLVLVERRADGALVSFDDAGRPGPSFDVHGPFEPLFSAALTADGKQLALSWKTKTTSTSALFDPATGAVLSPLPPPKRTEIVGLAFSADGKHLVAETWPPENLELWDVPQRRHLAAWETNKAGLLYFNFSPDGGHILAVGSDESSYQWEVPSGQLLEVHRGAGSRSNIAALSPDGNWIAAGGKDGVLRIVSAKSGELVAEFQGHTDELRRVAFSPDGRSVWTASTDGTARYWDLATSGDPRVLRHECYVYALAYSPDGRWFASSSWQNSGGGPSDIHLWDAASGQPVALLRGHTDWVACLTITPDGKRIVAVDHSGSVHVWDTADGRRRKLPLTIRQQGPSYVQTSVTSPDGRLLALPDERQLRLWNLQSDKEEAAFATSLSGLRIAVFSPDGTRLAVAGVEPEAQILSVPKGEVLVTLRRHTRQVNAVNFSPDGSRIVTASEDRSVRLWDAATGELQTVLGGAKGVGHTQAVFAAVFHPDGTRIATGGRDRGVRIWDTATGEELVRLAGHTDYVFRLAFSPDGATLVSGSGDGTVRLWDAAPLRERIKARRELETLRPQADALVDRLLRQGCNADEVVERLGADADLSEPLRRAAWHALLRRR